jgi:hypothetical protein
VIDHHIHFGQFEEACYEPLEIMRIITEAGIRGCVYTSTSSCIDDVKCSTVESEIMRVVVRYPADAFVPRDWMKQLVQAGLGQKIFTGSDFPITHFSQNNMSYTLEEQYLRDIEEMKFWEEHLWETGNA